MSASATEMLFAMGAGPQVEAVDMTSNYPEDAPVTDLSAFTPNAEAIAGYQPDLVVLSDDLNGIVAALDALSIPTLLLGAPDTLEESYEQFETLGAATGHADDAAKAVQDVQDRIDAAIESAADAEGMRSTTSSTRPTTPRRARRSSAASTGSSVWRTSPTRLPARRPAIRSCRRSTWSGGPGPSRPGSVVGAHVEVAIHRDGPDPGRGAVGDHPVFAERCDVQVIGLDDPTQLVLRPGVHGGRPRSTGAAALDRAALVHLSPPSRAACPSLIVAFSEPGVDRSPPETIAPSLTSPLE